MCERKVCVLKKVFVDSLAYCEEASLDTQRLISLIKASSKKNNYVLTKSFDEADLLIYNACGHLQTKQDDSIREIKELLKRKIARAKSYSRMHPAYFTCSRCGRIVRAQLYREKNSLRYWSLKKLKLCPMCAS